MGLYVKHVIYPFGLIAGLFFAREKLFQARETRYQVGSKIAESRRITVRRTYITLRLINPGLTSEKMKISFVLFQYVKEIPVCRIRITPDPAHLSLDPTEGPGSYRDLLYGVLLPAAPGQAFEDARLPDESGPHPKGTERCAGLDPSPQGHKHTRTQCHAGFVCIKAQNPPQDSATIDTISWEVSVKWP